MADRQLKITIRTEIRKGFDQLSKQLQSVTNSLNKLNANFDKAAVSANKAAASTARVNKQVSDGVRLANQYASAQDKAGQKAIKLNEAVKAGELKKQQALKAEINILNELIKKTGDLSALEKRRDSKGRFGYGGFSADAVKAVREVYAKQEQAARQGGTKLVTVVNDQAQRIKIAMDKLTMAGTNTAKGQARKDLQAFYEGLFSTVNTEGVKLVTSIDGQAMRIRAAMDRLTAAGSKQTNKHYSGIFSGYAVTGGGAQYGPSAGPGVSRRVQGGEVLGRAGRGGSGGSGGGFGGGSGGTYMGPSSNSVSAVQRLYDAYVKLGHTLFLIKYSFLTIFGLSGVGYVVKQADAFIDLRNEVARTSDSINDLGENMKSVYDISKATFSDAGTVGKLFSTINKYSKALNLDQTGVAKTTQAITGAFAASPGTRDAKNAAQYQFVQALQSNRLGGDELRSIIEQAPYVGEILSKGVAKVRGVKGPVNLRDKENPVRAEEIAKVFSDPAVLKEIMDTLANRSRSFSDVLAVAKTRLIEMVGGIEGSTSVFSRFNNTVARFLANDQQFNALTTSLTNATVAAATFAAALSARSGLAAVGGIAGKANLGGTAAGIAGAFALAPLTTLKNLFKDLIPNVMKLVVAFGKLLTTKFAIAAAIGTVVARFNHLTNKFGDGVTTMDMLASAFSGVVDAANAVAAALSPAIQGLWSLIDGPLMFLMRAAKNNEGIQTSNLNRRFGVSATGFQSTQGKNPGWLGLGPDSKWNPFGANGAVTTAIAGKPVANLNSAKIAPGAGIGLDGKPMTNLGGYAAMDNLNLGNRGSNWMTKEGDDSLLAIYDSADPKKRKLIGYRSNTAGLPSGQKSDLPLASGTDKKGRHRQDPWAEFMRDMQGNLSEAKFGVTMLKENFNENTAEAFADFAKNVKNAADKANIVTGGKSIAEVLDMITKAKGDAFSKLNTEVFQNKITELYETQIQGYARAIANAALEASQNKYIYGQTAQQQEERSGYNQLVNQFKGNINLDQAQKLYQEKFGKTGSEVEVRGYMETQLAKLGGGKRAYDYLYRNADERQRGQMDDASSVTLGSISEKYKDMANPLNGVKDAVAEYFSQLQDVAGRTQEVISRTISSLEDAFVQFVTTGKLSFKSLVQSILADFAQLAARNVFSSILQLGARFLPTAISTMMGVPVMHSGGVVGNIGASRSVHPSIFSGATRYHTGGIAGLKPDEVPAILQRGERIIPRGGSNGGGSTYAPVISINYTAGASSGNMNQEEHAKNIAAMVQGAMRKEIMEYERKSKMPGTDAYLSKRY